MVAEQFEILTPSAAPARPATTRIPVRANR